MLITLNLWPRIFYMWQNITLHPINMYAVTWESKVHVWGWWGSPPPDGRHLYLSWPPPWPSPSPFSIAFAVPQSSILQFCPTLEIGSYLNAYVLFPKSLYFYFLPNFGGPFMSPIRGGTSLTWEYTAPPEGSTRESLAGPIWKLHFNIYKAI